MIHAENITKAFKQHDGSLKTVLQSISFHAQPGQSVRLSGRSGSGKSTLLNIISGLLLPDSGAITIDKTVLHSLSESVRDCLRHEKVGYIFQTFNLLSPLSAAENVYMPARLAGKRTPNDKKKAMEMLEQLGMSGHADKFPFELSVGQRQRVAVARVLFQAPPIVLADEPTASLDALSAEQVTQALLSLRAKGTTLIFASHDPALKQLAADITIELSQEVVHAS